MSIKLKGSSDGSVSFDAPADTSPSGSDITLTLPTSAGSADQFLKNSGIAGELEYSSMVETSTGVGIGVSSPSKKLHVSSTGAGVEEVQWLNNAQAVGADVGAGLVFTGTTNNNGLARIAGAFQGSGTGDGGYLKFDTRAQTSGALTERMRLDSSGRLLINNTNALGNYPLQVTAGSDANAIVIVGRSSDDIGELSFFENDRTTALGELQYRQDHLNLRHRVGDIRFATGGVTERMRITSDGTVLLNGQTSNPTGATTSLYTNSASGSAEGITVKSDSTSGNRFMIGFYNNANSKVGDIVYNGTTTAYNQTSDYRLKENVVAITDGITRIKQLNPSRFNFIGNTETTVDGFLAHEVQSVVSEAVTGDHNGVDDSGNPVYQGIDQSKLVPLLTAALQEAIAKIETLETKVAALEAA